MLYYKDLRGLSAREIVSALALSRYCCDRDARKFIALRRKRKTKSALKTKTARR